MPLAPTARLFSLVSAHAALGLLYAALLERGAGVLADFESAELDGTTRALVWVVPPMAALVGWLVARTIDRDGDGASARTWRPLRALGWTLGAGVVAGLLASAAAV